MERAKSDRDAGEEQMASDAGGERTANDAGEDRTTSDADRATVRVWMVERTYARDEHNIVVTYATTDGREYLRRSRTRRVLIEPTTAAIDVSPDRLEAVEHPERRERYATEAARMADRHAPDDEV